MRALRYMPVPGGYKGSVPLCERGLRTLLIEHGRPLEHHTDYRTEGVDQWHLPNRHTAPPMGARSAESAATSSPIGNTTA